MHYKLDENKNVIPCSLEKVVMTKEKSIVKQEDILDKWVSTVFLFIDHNYGRDSDSSLPIVFETMIKNKKSGEWMDYQERYCTWKEAEEGHQRAVEWVKNGCKDSD